MSSDERRGKMSRRVLRGFDPARFRTLRLSARDGEGLTVGDVARAAGVSISTIYQWESGVRTPQVDILAKVAGAIEVEIADLVMVPPDKRYPSDIRILKGYTQPKLGQEAGLPTVVVGRLERGETPLSEPVCATLAALLEVSTDTYRAAYERARARPSGTLA